MAPNINMPPRYRVAFSKLWVASSAATVVILSRLIFRRVHMWSIIEIRVLLVALWLFIVIVYIMVFVFLWVIS